MMYGPQTSEIEKLIEVIRGLTDEQINDLSSIVAWDAYYQAARDAAWHAAWCATLDEVRYAARDATRDATWGAAWDATRYAAWHAAWCATRDAARYAAWDAVEALLVRDLITDDGFTQEHYELLTWPWRTVIGPIHPDDEEVKS